MATQRPVPPQPEQASQSYIGTSSRGAGRPGKPLSSALILGPSGLWVWTH